MNAEIQYLRTVCALFVMVLLCAGAGSVMSQTVFTVGSEHDRMDEVSDYENKMSEGAAHYAFRCATCHGPEGAGAVGPSLRANVASLRGLVRVAVLGRHNMPPAGYELSDQELAALATFIRNSWGNNFGSVSAQDVAVVRP